MANTPQSPGNDDVQSQRDIDEVFSRANPNPDRVGCPSREELAALAARRLPIDSPGYEHLGKCSPCYREFRALQQQPSASVASPGSRWVPALVAALIVVVGGAWWLTRDAGRSGTPTDSVSSMAALRAELDLRPFSVTRSDQPTSEPAAVALPTGVVDVTLLLPVGAEAGTYDVQLLDSELRSRADATGTAAIVNYVTTLRVRLDLHQLTPGQYQLAVRRQGDSWRMFPVTLR